jgi:hypothetical protein
MENNIESQELSKLGFSISVNSGPTIIREEIKKNERFNPSINARFCVKYGIGLRFTSDPAVIGKKPDLSADLSFFLGVGHLKVPKSRIALRRLLRHSPEQFSGIINTIEKRPNVDFSLFLDQAEITRFLSAVAFAQYRRGVCVPLLSDIVSSVMLDGSTFVNGLSFSEWCDEYGYDDDSIKAHKMWEQCDSIGRGFTSRLPDEIYAKVEKILENY